MVHCAPKDDGGAGVAKSEEGSWYRGLMECQVDGCTREAEITMKPSGFRICWEHSEGDWKYTVTDGVLTAEPNE